MAIYHKHKIIMAKSISANKKASSKKTMTVSTSAQSMGTPAAEGAGKVRSG